MMVSDIRRSFWYSVGRLECVVVEEWWRRGRLNGGGCRSRGSASFSERYRRWLYRRGELAQQRRSLRDVQKDNGGVWYCVVVFV